MPSILNSPFSSVTASAFCGPSIVTLTPARGSPFDPPVSFLRLRTTLPLIVPPSLACLGHGCKRDPDRLLISLWCACKCWCAVFDHSQSDKRRRETAVLDESRTRSRRHRGR